MQTVARTLLVVALIAGPASGTPAAAATFVVNLTGSVSDATPVDALCDVDAVTPGVIESVGAGAPPLVVERAMYWNALGRIWTAGTAVLGTRLP